MEIAEVRYLRVLREEEWKMLTRWQGDRITDW